MADPSSPLPRVAGFLKMAAASLTVIWFEVAGTREHFGEF
jgi:hypothetical protein